jgi:hypothetical protein
MPNGPHDISPSHRSEAEQACFADPPTASAEATRLGGRVGSTRMRRVNEDGVLIATGAASYILAWSSESLRCSSMIISSTQKLPTRLDTGSCSAVGRK